MSDKPWWFTQDEEHLHGSRPTREEAIAAGTHEYGGDPFLICQGGHFRNQAPHIDIDYLAEAFDDANNEYSGEDSDQGTAAEWSDESCRDLETMITAAFDAWLDKHDYRKAWAIDCGPYEKITPTRSNPNA